MPDRPDNPYAPPSSPDPTSSAPSAPGDEWYVEGNFLQVRDGTALPRVDLLEGRTDGDLLPGLMIASSQRSMTLAKSGAPAVARFQHYISRQAALPRARKIARWHPRAIVRFGILLMLAAFFASRTPEQKIGVGLAYAGFLSLMAWAFGDLGRIKSVPLRNGWIQLRRVAPEALRQLEALRARPPASPAPMRKVLVCRVYFQRYPLSAIVNRQWRDPFFALGRVLSRLLQPRSWEVDLLEASLRIPISEADFPQRLRDLLDGWRHSSPEFSNWQIVEAYRMPYLARFIQSEHLQLCSADLLHSVTLSLTSITVAMILREEESWDYSTLLQSGQRIITHTTAVLTDLAPDLEISRSKGPRGLAWPRHLVSIGDRPISPVATPSDWITRRLDKDGLILAAIQQRGLADPFREIEVSAAVLDP